MNDAARAVDWAVWRFETRVGVYGSFGADDARQEAMIAVWRTGKASPTVAYSAILDALRKLIPGFRAGRVVEAVMHDDTPIILKTLDSPDEVLAAKQLAQSLEDAPAVKPRKPYKRKPKAAPVAVEATEDPEVARIRREAAEASFLYAEMMRA